MTSEGGGEWISVMAQGAIAMFELFGTLVAAGFTEDQAIKLVAQIVKNGD